MNDPIRIMLCDDSAVMRRLIKTALQTDPMMAVVSEAKHGLDALNKLYDARPDVLVMDVQMPVMDGIDAVREIRKRTSKLPVIMFSSLTSHGAEATQDALSAGATEVASKPASIGHIKDAMDHVQKELIPKIYRSLGIVPRAVAPRRTAPPRAIRAQNVSRPMGRQSNSGGPSSSGGLLSSGWGEGLGAIGVGVSTGGPEALEQLISALPLDFPSPILVVQHMPPVFTKRLADRLAMKTGHRIREATNGEELRAGEILIAPGDHHLLTVRDRSSVRAKLTKDAPENSCRPSVDPLFRSLADTFGDQCLGVVLTGMGKDGTNGARALRKRGAEVMVQDKQSSVVWGMAGSIVENGLSDEVLPLNRMAEEILRRARGRTPVR